MSVVIANSKIKIRRAFANAAESYDSFAHLQRMVAQTLLRKSLTSTLQGRILDIGCGTGFLTQQLLALGGYQQLIALDLAQPMLQKARQGLQDSVVYICGDAESLPLQNASIDSVFSSLALQWCQNLPSALLGFKRVLKPHGRLVFATFGAHTLKELKQAWSEVDGYRHVNDFYTPGQLQTILLEGGWQGICVDSKLVYSKYDSVTALLCELKGIGAQHITSGHKPQLTSKTQFQKMVTAYPLCSSEGGVKATYEIIWVIAEAG